MMATEEESKTNLIINYVPQSLTDEKFRNMFTLIGPLKSSKICRDKSTDVSFGYGFVDYEDPEHAELAIQKLNGKEVEDKRIKVALSKPGGAQKNTLYVSNLPKSFAESDVQNIFQDCGNIISVRMLRDANGESRGVSFVLFNKKYEADKAIDVIDNKIPQGGSEPIRVKFKREKETKPNTMPLMSMPFMPSAQQQLSMQQQQKPQSLLTMQTNMHGMQQQQAMMNNSFGGRMNSNFGGQMNRSFGNQMNSNFGGQMNRNRGGPMRNESARMRYNPMAAGNNFNQHLAANSIMEQDSCMAMMDQAQGDYCVFVHNVGPECKKNELYRLFAPFGAVQKVDIVMDQDKDQCKGFAFVHYVNQYEAMSAIQSLNGTIHKGKQLSVRFKQ